MTLDFATLFPTAEPARQKLVGWWQARSRREQILLAVMGALIALWLLISLIVLPIQRARAEALADIRTYEALTARLRSAGTIGSQPVTVQGGPPAQILSTTAATFGIVPVVNGDGSDLSVTVADAPYDSLLRWIAAVEQGSRLRVTALRIERRPTSGFVSASLVVRP
ncbi:type II secretion system protein M [Rhizorhabdus dicambivorans]|uniref:Type II secretion system protein M n=1 Tax=Rhizorhabdus dicambivorans TaxID=1850238 RepID=A0A2A4FUL2_9SPHN|nr:type II secretion system protein M [Rhizorhabdus dicambivorans]ATE63536.1 type II secretion system protein M [Rhizorhabdus dicambivorans]PCE41410.1 type II secretion system protein M [Rhizorhabdus dicambivorans]